MHQVHVEDKDLILLINLTIKILIHWQIILLLRGKEIPKLGKISKKCAVSPKAPIWYVANFPNQNLIYS